MAFVQGVVYKRIAPGQTLTIFGGFFDGSCSVYFGDTKVPVVDYEESQIEVVVPIEKGNYKVTLKDGSNRVHNVCDVAVMELADIPRRNAPKEYTRNDFFNYVLSLMPRGNALAIWNGSYFQKLMTALAGSFKYTWEVIKSMVDAVDPTHTENFADWENELNLPVLGIYPQTFEGRRSEIYRVECCEGGCSVEYMKHILFLMGIDADVYEYKMTPTAFADYNFGDDDPNFFFKILFHLHKDDFNQFRAGVSCAGDYLLDFTQYKEEAVFNEIKPSHTKIILGYKEMNDDNVFVDGSGRYFTTSSGKILSLK